MNRTTLALTAAVAALGVVPFAAHAAKPPKPPKSPGNLTLAAATNPVNFGRSVTLSGKLTGPKNSGKPVSLLADPFPYNTFTKVTTATTSATGDYSTTQKPSVNTRYRASQGGNQSAIITVLVRPAVSLRLGDYTPKRGQSVRFSGRVCPQHDGSSLSIQRRYSRGYRTIRKTALRDIPGSTCSSYRKTFRVFRDGRFRTVIGSHADHARGISRSRVARVH
jgi:hypothetical protein